jgi:hypothetical protein
MTEIEIVLSDEMCQRAWDAYCEARDAGFDEPVEVMRAALRGAFDEVPLTNYGIGLALQFFDLVICVKDREHSPAAGVYRRTGKPHEFDAVPHTLEVNWGYKPTRYIKRVAVSRLEAPDGAA